MERFELQPVLTAALPEVSKFLHGQTANRGEDWSVPYAVQGDPLSIERRLMWLLFENPLSTGSSPQGFCIRDPFGAIRGLTLCFPVAFLAGDQRLFGLCSGSFFVEPEARAL